MMMKQMKHIGLNFSIVLAAMAILFLGCGDENLNNIAANQFVIEAFLYAGEPIDDIKVKTTFPLAEVDDISVPINDAQVTLIKDGQRFSLVSSGQDGFYNYPGDDLQVETADIFDLEVTHNGITATAQTIVPRPTEGLRLSQDTLPVPRLPLGMGQEAVVEVIRKFVEESMIEAFWDNPNEDLHFMVVEAVKDTVDPIFIQQVIDALSRFRFVSEPTDASSITFLAGTVESFGSYSVRVYRINAEYAALYENRSQDSRDLNEPPSNVQNALGVFSAFNSQELFFEVVRE